MTSVVTVKLGVLVAALIGAALVGGILWAVLAVLVARGVAKRLERIARAGETRTVVTAPRLSKLELTGFRSWN